MRSRKRPEFGSRPGVAVDASGGQVVDPTENVKALSEASNIRQDDLRAETRNLYDVKFAYLKEIGEIKAAHLKEMAEIRERHAEKLREAESDRINAIRAVDVAAVNTASERAADQAAVLAAQLSQYVEQSRTQVATSAETLRSLVATTATSVAAQQAQVTGGLSARITTLEQQAYKGEGVGQGIGTSWAVFIAAGMLLIGIFGAVYMIRSSPTVQYLPSGPAKSL